MSKRTPLAVQNDVIASHEAFHSRARAARQEYYDGRKVIMEDTRLSAQAQEEDAARLLEQTVAKIQGILGEQQSYVEGLKASLEKELRGNLPQDANSIMLRRDAADRARRVQDEKEALAVLADAVATSDDTMAHAIGTKARNSGWINAAEAWQAAHPDTSGVAEALTWVEGYTSGVGYNMANGAAYQAPDANG
ncbi:hypothetical protein [Microbacterium hominis]|uniref:Uncharacterized protein n=1 Tax=Microbacterium hominis TaxID=162426 RepID=A0A7D4Q0F8_9MICO|nr:hypothetical protein [Microbacterium hominis]QKJ19172.1 hypothetical protein HQM25_07175 [Microbacterium hominis]